MNEKIVKTKKLAGRLRVALLTNAVPAYRRPVLESFVHDSGMFLRVFVSLPLDFSDRQACETLSLHHSRGVNIRRRTRHPSVDTEQIEWLHIPLMLILDLLSFRPDLVISGEFGLRSLVGYGVATLRRVPFVLWSEEIEEKTESLSPLQRTLRKFLIPRADGFLAWGNPAVQYLKSWNVPDQKIYYCAQAVDNEFWQSRSKGHDKKGLRITLGLHGKVFLAVGNLVRLKGFDKLLLAWSSIPFVSQKENTLVLVGCGQEELALRRLAKQLGIPNMIFTGSQSPDQLAQWYASADVFVFPSLVDVWGLVVNEAMACGLPVLASKYAGASQELVQGTGGGELFDPNDVQGFAAILARWCLNGLCIEPAHLRAIVAKLNFGVSVGAFRRVVSELGGMRPS